MYMSCTYKKYNSETDGPSSLYHRMNQIDCTMKKFGGGSRSKGKRHRNKYLKRKTVRKHRGKTRNKFRPYDA